MYKELFVEYHKIKKEIKELTREKEKLEDKKDEYFIKTQPKSSDPSKELIKVGGNSDKFINYTANTVNIDNDIAKIRKKLRRRKQRLRLKWLELKESRYVLDRIYKYAYVERRKVEEYYKLINYSKRQTYRKLEEIAEKLKDGTKWHKFGAIIYNRAKL